MKIKRIKKLKVNISEFKVIWDETYYGASFDYAKPATIRIGTKLRTELELLGIITHELWEIVACEMTVRFRRTDCGEDYIFVYDHRQHTTMCEMFVGLLNQFIE